MSEDRLQTFGFVRNVDEDNRRVQVVVSTGDLARDDAIIDQRGWDFSNYDRNPVVLWAHDDRSLPIAKAVPSLRVQTDNELVETHEFATHAHAEEVWQLVKGGFVSATSVRWLPGKTTVKQLNGRSVLVFTEGHELLESSYVPIPADPGCLVVRADGSRLVRREGHRMVIDFSMACGVRGCPNEGWDATYDICKWHHDLFQSGEVPLPQVGGDESAKAIATESEARLERVANWADTLRATNERMKEHV